MELFDRYLVVRIVTASPEILLSRMTASNIELSDVQFIDSLTMELKVRNSQYSQMKRILIRVGAKDTILKKVGILWCLNSLMKRSILIAGIFLFLFVAGIAPNRIFFLSVSGNEKLPDKMIISQVQECGVLFGMKASEIRSEEIKNQLLGRIPELQWVGITTSGSTAIIHVAERSTQDEAIQQPNMISNIVAARDGVITQMTVQKGTALSSVGQTVAKGDILVSGYTDCGIKIVAERAAGEIFAHTFRENSFVSPVNVVSRGDLDAKKTCYQLRIGKKVIKLCNHSGISDVTCVKMYSENYWTLPGGFQLPFSVIKVENLCFDQIETKNRFEQTCQWLTQFARSYLQQQMIAGVILDEELCWDVLDETYLLSGTYACNEMIGQVKDEEIIEQNAEDN